MKRIVFYTENKWALGTIHFSLCKYLFSYGVNCEILDFTAGYSLEEMQSISETIDAFVTNYPSKLINEYQISPEKIIFMAHGQWDILLCNSQTGINIYEQLAGYAVVSNILKQKSAEFGVCRVPQITHLGIEFDRFYHKPNTQINRMGFAGALESFNFAGQEIKRGKLVSQLSERLGIPLEIPQHHYLAMPKFYQNVDAIIMSSIEEGAGLPMMEAAAAGRLTLGTAVGYYAENPTGIHLPLDQADFTSACCEHLIELRENPTLYQNLCESQQQYARDHYDWQHHIETWANFLQ